MADIIVSAAGAAIGFVVGGPAGAQWGWALGSLIGQAFAPGQKSQGPRLDDLTVTGMAYGQPIPWIQGTHRSAGQLIWSSDRREIATTVKQGKGGAKSQSTTYTYEVDCLFLLSCNELDGLLRVWNNGKLAFTADADASDASVIASTETDLWRRITFYGGAPGQMPDPVYEAAVGAGNAPAYLDMATVFIEGLQLGQSGQMLNLTFEVGTNLSPATLQNFQDFSGNNVPVTVAFPSTPTLNRWGGCVESPAKFGASGKFNGGNNITPGDALRAFDNDAFRLFPVDWSIRCWAYDTGDADVQNYILAFGADDGLNEGLIVYREDMGPGSKIRANYRGPATLDIVSSIDHPLNEWFYFEITKSGTIARMFINGVLAGTQTGLSPDEANIYGRPGQFCIGGRYGFGVPWQGYIDDFVFENAGGNVVDYTPPTAPYESTTQTLLHIPFYYADTVQRGVETIRTVVEPKSGSSSKLIAR